MSDTKPAQSAPQKPFRLSMTKAGGPAQPVPHIKPPRTIDYACVAMGVMVVATWAQALLLLGNTGKLAAYLTDLNKHAKKPQANFDALKSVHHLRQQNFFQAVLYTVVVLLLIWAMRRARSASASRWALVIVFFFTGMVWSAITTWGLPTGPKVAGVVISVAAVATIALVFVAPASVKYFRQCREATLPPERRGQERPGLGSLFKPRPPRTAPPSAPRPEPAQRPAMPKAKAKVRADSDAVAKGADLARSRAKASKSRRTVD